MDLNFYQKLQFAFSQERLDSYVQHDGANELIALSRYLWNMAICESLYSPLQIAEVALRNVLHSTLAKHFSTDQWYESIPLNEFGQNQIKAAKERLNKQGKPVTPGKMVAELHFGFWTSLFNKTHSGAPWIAILLKNCFPNAPKHMRNIKQQSRRWDKIRTLRNKVFHHERIIHWKDLSEQHSKLLETIGWISPELLEMTNALDRFEEIKNSGIDPWKEKIKKQWPALNGT